jgi:hypothetical protein
MKLNNKGQAGPLGEDMIYLIVVVLAISALLVVVVKAFADHEIKYAKLDSYRSAQVTADKVSTMLAWESGQSGVIRSRVLDADALVGLGGSCDEFCKDCMIRVIDRDDGGNPDVEKELWSCGNTGDSLPDPDLLSASIKLPVSIRIDITEFHPGILEVTVVR